MSFGVFKVEINSGSGWRDVDTEEKLYYTLVGSLEADQERIKEIFRDQVIKFYKEIVSLTPVDSGSARFNWRMAEGDSAGSFKEDHNPKNKGWNVDGDTPDFGDFDSNRAVGDYTDIDLPKELTDFGGRISVTIFNNLPYISSLDDGTLSRQSSHMIEQAKVDFVARFNLEVQKTLG